MLPLIESTLVAIAKLAPIVGCLIVENWPVAVLLSIAFFSYACIIMLGLLLI